MEAKKLEYSPKGENRTKNEKKVEKEFVLMKVPQKYSYLYYRVKTNQYKIFNKKGNNDFYLFFIPFSKKCGACFFVPKFLEQNSTHKKS